MLKWVVIQLILFGYIEIINLEKKTNRKCNASIVKIFFSKLNLMFLIGVYWVSKACMGGGACASSLFKRRGSAHSLIGLNKIANYAKYINFSTKKKFKRILNPKFEFKLILN